MSSTKLSFTRADQLAVEGNLSNIVLLFVTMQKRESEAAIEKLKEELVRVAKEAGKEVAMEGAREDMRLACKAAVVQNKKGKAAGNKKEEARAQIRKAERKVTYAAVVGTKDKEAGARTELARCVEAGEIEGGFTQVKKRTDGRLVLVTESEEKHRKPLEAASKEGGRLTTESTSSGRKLLRICGVETGNRNKKFVETMARENKGVFRKSEEQLKDDVSIIRKFDRSGGIDRTGLSE